MTRPVRSNTGISPESPYAPSVLELEAGLEDKGKKRKPMTSRASIDGQLEVKDFGSDVYKTLQKESWGLRLGTADAEGASNISFKPIYWTQ